MAKQLMHEGDYAARGGVVIATSECGNYGEDTLTAWKLANGAVVVERERKSAPASCWRIDATDTLRVSSKAWGAGGIVGLESDLVAIAQDGEEIAITHFEFSSPWGGVSDDEVAMLAEAIANEACCAVDIVPTKYPEHMTSRPEPAVPTPARPPEPPPPPPPPLPLPAKPLPDGAELLASIACGDNADEQLRSIRIAGAIWIENAMTGARWQIARGDVLVVTAYAVAGGPGGVWTCLERIVQGREERIAGFYCWDNEHKGPDEAAVVAFVEQVVGAAGCTLDHRPFVWD